MSSSASGDISDSRTASEATSLSAADSPRSSESEFRPSDAAAALDRLEKLLREIRGSLETTTREQQHQEFSIARMVGAIVQAVAIGLLGWSLLDFLFEASSMTLLKIALAGVFQLMALTAFFLSREKA